MNTLQDRYNITTFDRDGAPDWAITNVTTSTAQRYIRYFEKHGVEFVLQLRETEEV